MFLLDWVANTINSFLGGVGSFYEFGISSAGHYIVVGLGIGALCVFLWLCVEGLFDLDQATYTRPTLAEWGEAIPQAVGYFFGGGVIWPLSAIFAIPCSLIALCVLSVVAYRYLRSRKIKTNPA